MRLFCKHTYIKTPVKYGQGKHGALILYVNKCTKCGKKIKLS